MPTTRRPRALTPVPCAQYFSYIALATIGYGADYSPAKTLMLFQGELWTVWLELVVFSCFILVGLTTISAAVQIMVFGLQEPAERLVDGLNHLASFKLSGSSGAGGRSGSVDAGGLAGAAGGGSVASEVEWRADIAVFRHAEEAEEEKEEGAAATGRGDGGEGEIGGPPN